jgi:glyoxylase I family protein
MDPLGIHHVSINVADVTRSVRFYVEVLGGSERTDRPDFPFAGAWIDLGDQQLHLIEATVPKDVGQHFAIRVAQLDATVAELRARALEVSVPVAVGTSRQSFLRDPDDNLIELHQIGG